MTTPVPQTTTLDDVRRLTLSNLGWTERDMDGLVADWPRLNTSAILSLVGNAVALTEIVSDPAQARAWLRVLYEPYYPEFAPRATVTATLLKSMGVPADTMPLPSRIPAVAAFHRAAAGNGDLARAAVAAGLSLAEVDALATADDPNLNRLRALAGLRGIHA